MAVGIGGVSFLHGYSLEEVTYASADSLITMHILIALSGLSESH